MFRVPLAPTYGTGPSLLVWLAHSVLALGVAAPRVLRSFVQ